MLVRFARCLLAFSAAGALSACAAHAPAAGTPCPPSVASAAGATPAPTVSVSPAPSPTPTEATPPPSTTSTAPNAEPERAPRPRDTAAFNAWLDKSEQARDLPLLVAQAFAGAEARNVTVAVSYASGESAVRATATVTLDGLLDDSVRGEEHVLTFMRTTVEAPWRLEGATSRVRCWQGRGHAEFSAAPCT